MARMTRLTNTSLTRQRLHRAGLNAAACETIITEALRLANAREWAHDTYVRFVVVYIRGRIKYYSKDKVSLTIAETMDLVERLTRNELSVHWENNQHKPTVGEGDQSGTANNREIPPVHPIFTHTDVAAGMIPATMIPEQHRPMTSINLKLDKPARCDSCSFKLTRHNDKLCYCTNAACKNYLFVRVW